MNLRLPVKKEYFDQIKSGRKVEEYRLVTPYWQKRIENKIFSQVIVTLGYPGVKDEGKHMVFPWNGYEKKTIVHPHFGDRPVSVYAIKLRRD